MNNGSTAVGSPRWRVRCYCRRAVH